MKKIVLAFLAITLLFACKKDDQVTDYMYSVSINSPDAEAKKVGDVLPIDVTFESKNGEEVKNINVKIYSQDDASTEIYNAPATATINEESGKYTFTDEFTLSEENGVAGHTNWVLEASVWSPELANSKVIEKVEFHVHPAQQTGPFTNSLFILNEGGYGKGNASLSVLSNNVITNNVFNSITGLDLGDTAQSIGFNGDHAFIVVNGSNKIEIVNRHTLMHMNTLTENLENPRYVSFNANKAYVTNWGDPSNADDDFVTVINLDDYTSTKVSVAEGPEKIITFNDKVYVAHKGGYSHGNTISVVSTSNDSVESTITVGDVPTSIVEENGSLYVLCAGKPSWTGAETNGALYEVSTTDSSITKTTTFAEGLHPSNLTEGNNALYYTLGTKVYTTDYALTISDTPLFSTDAATLYGFNVIDSNIYVGDAKDYASSGEVFVYDLNGVLANQYTTGVLPNGFYFNN